MKFPIKFPVHEEYYGTYPLDNICPICKEKRVGEPHSMAILSGGVYTDARWNEIPESELYWRMIWHGAHDTGEGDYRDLFTTVNIVDGLPTNEFQIIFCSTQCLRKFFNSLVDELEKKREEENQ